MRVKKTGGKEERLVLVLPDQFDNLRGNHAICMFVIAAFRIPPGHTDAKVSVLFLASAITSNLFLLRSIDANRIVPLIPMLPRRRCRQFQSYWDCRSDKSFLRERSSIRCFEKLPQCDNFRVLLAQFMLQRMHVEGVRP